MQLKHTRRARGLTQVELASKSGVDQRHISAMECGKVRNPSWEVVHRLSQALKARPEQLFPLDQRRTA